jgi:hypothetical protein
MLIFPNQKYWSIPCQGDEREGDDECEVRRDEIALVIHKVAPAPAGIAISQLRKGKGIVYWQYVNVTHERHIGQSDSESYVGI